jgi:tryptophan-rich sensory protein
LASIAALAVGASALAARFATASRLAASLVAPLVAWMWFATLLSATSGAAI